MFFCATQKRPWNHKTLPVDDPRQPTSFGLPHGHSKALRIQKGGTIATIVTRSYSGLLASLLGARTLLGALLILGWMSPTCGVVLQARPVSRPYSIRSH